MPKPSNRLARRLSSFRAGNLEDQRDKYRDDIFIDPNRYFRMSGNFGLGTKSEYERLEKAAPTVLEGIQSVEQSDGTRRRTRGIAGPNPDTEGTGMFGSETPPTRPGVRAQPVPPKRRKGY
jgi:hypothetical protein